MKGYSIFEKDGQFLGYGQWLVPTFRDAVIVDRIALVRHALKENKGSREINGTLKMVNRTPMKYFRETRDDVKYVGILDGNKFFTMSSAVYPLFLHDTKFNIHLLYNNPQDIVERVRYKMSNLNGYYDACVKDWVIMHNLGNTTRSKKEIDALLDALNNIEIAEYEFVPSF